MKNYLRRLRKILFFVFPISIILAIFAGYVYLFYNPILYTVSSTIKFSDAGSNIFAESGFVNSPEKIFENQSFDFLSHAQKQKTTLNISSDNKTLSISVKGKSAPKIYKIANTIAEACAEYVNRHGHEFIEERDKERLESIDVQSAQYKRELGITGEQLDDLEPRLESLQRQQKAAEGLSESYRERITALEIRRAELLRIYTDSHPEVAGIDLQLDVLREKLNSLPEVDNISNLRRGVEQRKATYVKLEGKLAFLDKQKQELLKSINKPGKALASISGYATKPEQPIGSLGAGDIYKRAIFVGILIGLIIAFIAGGINDSVTSECDFEVANIPDMPMIATLPFINPKAGKRSKGGVGKNGIAKHLLFAYEDSSEYVNAYRALATHIKLDALKGNIDKKAMLFTSTDSKMGKSTVSANLAIVLARLGKRVILLDANLNKTSVAKFFGIRARVLGIADILQGKARLDDCLKDVTDMLLSGIDWSLAMKTYGLDRLKILPSGMKVPDSAGLLESRAVGELFEELREKFDCIILDAPDLLKSPDPLILSQYVDAIFLVCKTGATSHRDMLRASRKLREVKVEFKGSVLVCT